MISRRGFLRSAASALILPVAPAIVRAESLMPIIVPISRNVRELVMYDIAKDAMVYCADFVSGGVQRGVSLYLSTWNAESQSLARERALKTLFASAGNPRTTIAPPMPKGAETWSRYLEIRQSGVIHHD